MSKFCCEVVRVTIEPHANADALELARVGDYLSVVKKGQYQTGELVIYVPEAAVVPEWILKQFGFWNEAKGKGLLAGSVGDRVKAVRLRGVISQGIVLGGKMEDGHLVLTVPPEHFNGDSTAHFLEGDDAAETLGIVKYEPPIPSYMAGRIIGADLSATHKYDFENLKRTPDLFDDGEEVVITEKIHGTLMSVSVVPASESNERYYKGRVIVTSKGMGAKGFVLDHDDETNLYAQAAKKWGLLDSALDVLGPIADDTGRPAFIFGEVFGRTAGGSGVQDLTYDDTKLDYRAFDICVGNRGSEQYAEHDEFIGLVSRMSLWPAPVLYVGPYSKEVVLQHTDGNTTLTTRPQIREGVVVKSKTEVRHPIHGRKIAKSVSADYLLRSGAATEFA